MKITRIPLYKRMLAKLALRAYRRGSGRADFDTNGERAFMRWILARHNRPIVCFDVGANVGNYSKALIDECTRTGAVFDIHAFEPVKRSFEDLKTMGVAGFQAVNAALSDKAGALEIYYDREGSSLASLYKRDAHGGESASEVIRTERGDEYVAAHEIRHIDLLKIDVEGHELSVFRGFGEFLAPANVSFIQFEYGGCDLDSRTTLRELYSLLDSRGFKIGRLLRDRVEIRPYNPVMEDFDYSNYIAIGNQGI